jgi:hypothetical protein
LVGNRSPRKDLRQIGTGFIVGLTPKTTLEGDMEEPENRENKEPEEIQAEVGHIVHEVTGGEGDLTEKPVPVKDVYAFRQRIVKPGEPIEPSEGERQEALGGKPPPPLPPPEDQPEES